MLETLQRSNEAELAERVFVQIRTQVYRRCELRKSIPEIKTWPGSKACKAHKKKYTKRELDPTKRKYTRSKAVLTEPIIPTAEVYEYLKRHKNKTNASKEELDKLWTWQISRAVKRALYIQSLVKQYKPKSMLDVGCGLGVNDIVIARMHKIEQLHLLDGDGNNPIQHGYEEYMQPWNSVFTAAKLIRNNTKGVVVLPHKVGTKFELDPSVDMVCSFKSWGTHYPVETYLTEVQQWLKPGGLLLIDIREERGSLGKNNLIRKAGFKLVHEFDHRLRAFERD